MYEEMTIHFNELVEGDWFIDTDDDLAQAVAVNPVRVEYRYWTCSSHDEAIELYENGTEPLYSNACTWMASSSTDQNRADWNITVLRPGPQEAVKVVPAPPAFANQAEADAWMEAHP